ncbi:MAG TPA: aminopeptidase P N-terminal domain-containing protein [Spirochaetia bacterium]|nr:aminopeptidase P N-terminal domain-containing protein [Spirochaetia bacterium]
MYDPDLGADGYRDRHRRVLDRLEKDSVAVVAGGPEENGLKLFRQTNDFYYLTGVETPQSYLLLDRRNNTTTLFLPHQTARERDQAGEIASVETADKVIAASGVDEVLGVEKLASRLERVTKISTPFREGAGAMTSWDTHIAGRNGRFADPWDGTLDRFAHFIELLRRRYPIAEIADLAPILNDMRIVKDAHEVELLRRAGKLTARGIIEAMRSTRAGIYEYQLAAILDYVYMNHGARGRSYNAIMATGANAWHGHYAANSSILQDGELVLGDCAPDYRYYASDIGRMWPVNGTYTDEQRQLYGFIVKFHKAYLQAIRPGFTDEEIRLRVAEQMKDVAASTKWIRPSFAKAAQWAIEFPYHMSHPVGLACHDDGHYRGKPLVPGVVLALDPQMRVDEERMYIRVEDTIVVTEDGVENFTSDAPLELDDVEALMKEEGMLQRYPADAFPLVPLC